MLRFMLQIWSHCWHAMWILKFTFSASCQVILISGPVFCIYFIAFMMCVRVRFDCYYSSHILIVIFPFCRFERSGDLSSKPNYAFRCQRCLPSSISLVGGLSHVWMNWSLSLKSVMLEVNQYWTYDPVV